MAKTHLKQVFQSNLNAYGEYRDLRKQLSQLQIIIESQSPEFQALHWEALKDPDLPLSLSIDCIISRQRLRGYSCPGANGHLSYYQSLGGDCASLMRNLMLTIARFPVL
jgi:hypothetical protein